MAATNGDPDRLTGLVITRRIDEYIMLTTSDGEIRIDVIRVSGRNVRLRFESPSKVKIQRGEVLDALKYDDDEDL